MFIEDKHLIGKEYVKDEAVYAALVDDLSKEIYEKRIDISRTGSEEILYEMLRLLPETQALMADDSDEEAYIFGCGEYGISVKNILDKKWKAFIDNNKYGQTVCGLPVLSFEEFLKEDANSIIYVTPKYQHGEIMAQLRSAGITDDRIVNVGKILMDMMGRQYFDIKELDLGSVDVFCDVGAYDGLNSKVFFEKSNKEARSVLLEPGSDYRDVIEANLSPDYSGRYELVQKGASDHDFISQRANYHVWGSNSDIEFVTLDELLKDEKGKIFIKCDIEGAEGNALDGAAKIIREKHPVLAISVYHKPQDIIDIPKKILSLYPQYMFYLRHYTLMEWDTVLYAIP